MSAFLADKGLRAQPVGDPVPVVNAQLDAFGSAARGSSSVADGLPAVDVSTPFGEAQGAMPGSEIEPTAPLARSSTITRTVADTAVPPDARDSREEPVALETGDDGLSSLPEPVLASLGGALPGADVVVRHLGEEAAALTGMFSGPGGNYPTSAGAGRHR